MKSAIIFGGSGFIGSHLLRKLVRSGEYDRLTSIDKVPPSVCAQGVDYRLHDLRSPIPPELCERYDEAYNLAAVHRTPGHPPHEYYETNVAGALHVCDFAAKTATPLLVFTSSIAVYGPGEDEKVECSPTSPVSDYGHSKLLAEEVHRRWLAAAPLRRLVIVRPAVIFGPGENGNFTRLATALAKGMFFFPGRRDTIKACGYVDELLESIAFAAARTEASILFNFCFPAPYTIEEICNAMSEVAGLPQPRGLVSRRVLEAVAITFETADKWGLRNGMNRARIAKLVNSTHVRPGFLIDQGYRFKSDLRDAFTRWLAATVDQRLN